MRLPLTMVFALLLVGCAAKPQVAPVPSPPQQPVASDPQRCLDRTDCTTKISRTLLFVYDYAEAGGALVQRKGVWLFTPSTAKPEGWPALKIRLADSPDGRFEFASQCPAGNCRISDGDLLRVYRSYLAGDPCLLTDAKSLARCLESTALVPSP
ncbi:hypothetical protein [Metapseudomonas resinovorans]|uniref:Lipoprotein n=1 Tax=Metapseudomonas resinovorans NBRC 106553 TaxID=1245471 RepID=S6AQK9_METRE|nr:hypothetical protein [Pseudomonas resinovorans]BAN46111.1 hypothetical protein PCA10_03790 [Pseudomonas resinovorans NBRC 106553]